MEKNNNKLRKVAIINYFFVLLIILFAFITSTYLIKWYANKDINTISIAGEIFSQITYNELDNFILENPNTIIYFASSKENNLAFEEELEKYVEDNYLKTKIVYLDNSTISDATFYVHLYSDLFNSSLKEKMSSISNYPNMFFIVDGKITNILYEEPKTININDVKSFVSKVGVIGNND